MIEIIGKYNVAKVFSDNIDTIAHAQITELCNTQAYKDSRIRVMPDVHAGMGCTIGTTMTISDKVCPNLVGVDIGCGLNSYNIGRELPTRFFEELDNYIRKSIPHGKKIHKSANPQFKNIFEPQLLNSLSKETFKALDLVRAAKSIASLGGGNHFIEIGKDIHNDYWLTVHSGSRNIGNQVAEYFQKKAITVCTDDIHASLKYLTKENLFDEYIAAMRIMQEYASFNRKSILSNIISFFGLEVVKDKKIETIHNYIDFSEESSLFLRKGAISAKLNELVLIPINMRDGILIAKGKGNPEWNYSAPHGAGRIYSRNQARSKLSLNEFEASMCGIYTTCVTVNTLDESPMAYKNMEEILEHIEDSVEIINRIKPVYNFKAS